jgi:predicted ribosome quality control (RQC) complex YloA/Tae2 family protein
LTPQKQAEILYKKSKNRPKELQRLEDQMRVKGNELQLLREERGKVEAIEYHKDLEPYVKKFILAPEKEQEEPALRFKECEYMGYKIYVGRSSDNNDELTQKFAAKDDLWLHAKDVSGSHVVVKYKAGQNFPKNVIEKAASLAAFYSKRKNETYCPVIYTQKKYVRKVKGAPKGSVRVERESVIMVEPRDF